MTRLTAILALLWAASTSSYGVTCEALKAEIDQKIRTAGVANYALAVADTGASAPGKVVGSCDKGTKKILYLPSASTDMRSNDAAAPVMSGSPRAKRKAGEMLTECKEGFGGPDCKRRDDR